MGEFYSIVNIVAFVCLGLILISAIADIGYDINIFTILGNIITRHRIVECENFYYNQILTINGWLYLDEYGNGGDFDTAQQFMSISSAEREYKKIKFTRKNSDKPYIKVVK